MDITSLLRSVKQDTFNFQSGILRPGQNCESHIVINLSDITISRLQISVPEKGLTFSPTPEYDRDLLIIWSDASLAEVSNFFAVRESFQFR